MSSSPWIAVVGDDAPIGAGTRWQLSGRMVIGRDEAADLVVALPAVSRRHAEVAEQSGRFAIRDLGSRNGTAINGVVLDDATHWLVDGDEVVLAGVATLRFVDPMATPIAPRVGRLHGLWIDPASDDVWVDGLLVDPPLTARQLRLVRLLDDADGAVVDRGRIVAEVWHDVAADGVSADAVTALVKRLRRRLDDTGARHPAVEVVRGRGVRVARRRPGGPPR